MIQIKLAPVRSNSGGYSENNTAVIFYYYFFLESTVLDLSISEYLIDKSNDLPPQPGQIKCSDIEPVQHDDATGRVVETLQQ